ncbi:MAG: hypothetical protein J6Q15_02110, partial [Clostridia bacterium]|nr:hypothetical protein [Clostridia bacterium]
MKKLLTIIAIFMTMLCGSIFLVSCSNNYKKMYLVVEYALPTEDGEDVEWKVVDADTNFDYVLSQDVYSNEDNSHILYLRVKVKGTSKKVDSLYVSQSANNSTFLQDNTIKPGEAFKVLVKNIGSVRFTVIPSHGGEDKSISFGVNVYKELTEISQNAECVPAVVVGGFVRLESLTNLIKYEPAGETNQTGVDFSLEGVGTLVNDGSNNLINRTFVNNTNYSVRNSNLIENISSSDEYINLDTSTGYLMLNVSTGYNLTTSNNVIKLKATSRYHEDISTDIYVYIVENFKSNSLLVSYSPDVALDNGNVPTDVEEAKPIPENIVLYNSTIDSAVVEEKYNAINMYTYTNASIYSYESNPGIKLNVFINDVAYDYNSVVNNAFGIQVSPIHKEVLGLSKLVGLKFEVNPNSTSTTNIYNVRLELDFTAFDFSASDKTPVSVLNKEFVVKVENLASGFHINGKGYADNLESFKDGEVGIITGYNSTKSAKLYTTYAIDAIGMPLNIQATPTNAIDTAVYVSFYEECLIDEITGKLVGANNLAVGDGAKLELLQSINSGLKP